MSPKGHARHWMTTPVESVSPHEALVEVARRLAAKRLGAVPVVNDAFEVVGIVSEVDVMRAMLKTGTLEGTAKSLMSTPVKSVNEFDTAESVMRLFREYHIHHLPVLREGRLVGLVTPADVLRYLVENVLPQPEQTA